MTLRYSNTEGGPSLPNVTLIYTWRRDTIEPRVLSASSGPKAYLRNDVWELLDHHPDVDQVAMVRGNGPPFFLLHSRSLGWMDIGRNPVEGFEAA